jgi:hypothetical protein
MPATMNAVLLLGHGGFEQLVYRGGVQIPVPGPVEVVSRTYPPREIAEAQRDFLSKRHTGKIVLQP